MRRYSKESNPSMAGATRTARLARKSAPGIEQQSGRRSTEVTWLAGMASRGHSEGSWKARNVGGRLAASAADAAGTDHCPGRKDEDSYSEANRRDSEAAG